jgi:hypothetical protein
MHRLRQTALCISILGTLAAASAYAQPVARKFGSWHMAFQPGNNALWCVVNERDGLGDDVPFE